MSDMNDNDEAIGVPNLLACDIGNSSLHFAFVATDKVSPMQRMRMGELTDLGAVLAKLWGEIPEPRRIVAVSVNPAGLKAFEAAVSEAIGQPVLVVGRELPLPIAVDIENPQTVGADRVCAAAAAYDRIGHACVVASFGTAITVDCVNEDGVFLGGAIMPGLWMSLTALHEHTAQLPQIELSEPQWVFGKNTRQAILTGVVQGARGALRQLVEGYATELGHWPVVILTGGDAELIAGDVSENDIVQAVVPDLGIRGASMAFYKWLGDKLSKTE